MIGEWGVWVVIGGFGRLVLLGGDFSPVQLNFLPVKVATNHDSTSMSSQSSPVHVDIVFI